MMASFLVAGCVVILWIGVTVFLSRIAVEQRTEIHTIRPDYRSDGVQKIGLGLIISTLITSLAVAFVMPIFFHLSTLGAVKWIHHIGVVLLGAFLAAALYFQIEIWMKRYKEAEMESVRRSYCYWRNLTELLPAPAALMILSSGMALIYYEPGYSIGRGWIFALIVVLAVMMADGIFGYTRRLRLLLHSADIAVSNSQPLNVFVKSACRTSVEMTFLAHSLSFPFVVVFPAFKIADSYSPASTLLSILHVENNGGWSQVWPALVLFAGLFLIVAAVNRFGRVMRSV
jgi:hypothetical protein